MDSVLVNTAQTVTNETSLLAIAMKGGILMVILAIISILAISIIIERYLKYKKLNKNEEEFMQEIYGLVSENKIDMAIHSCDQRTNSPIARIIARSIGTSHRDYLVVKEIAESALKKEVHVMERKLGTLATFAAIAPLIGFLGTVTGMVKVFMKLGESGGGVDISLLANGIWEALITTIGGLSVGIITIMFYNNLVGRVEEIAQDLEDNANDFILTYRRVRDEN